MNFLCFLYTLSFAWSSFTLYLPTVFLFKAVYEKVVAKNLCSLKLLSKNRGTAYAYATDFAEMVDENVLVGRKLEVRLALCYRCYLK